MDSDYRFLTDHSYSMLDCDKLALKQPMVKIKKHRKASTRSSRVKSTNRTVLTARSLSDKENNSANTIDLLTKTINNSGNNTTSSAKKKRSRPRMSGNLRVRPRQKDNKISSKTSTKSTSSNTIKRKNAVIKPAVSHSIDTTDALPSLSIEERVKLRRTTPFLTPSKPLLKKKAQSNIRNAIHKPTKRMHHLSKSNKSIIKTKKNFLGSGLDLDNIVLGNRQRRSVQT